MGMRWSGIAAALGLLLLMPSAVGAQVAFELRGRQNGRVASVAGEALEQAGHTVVDADDIGDGIVVRGRIRARGNRWSGRFEGVQGGETRFEVRPRGRNARALGNALAQALLQEDLGASAAAPAASLDGLRVRLELDGRHANRLGGALEEWLQSAGATVVSSDEHAVIQGRLRGGRRVRATLEVQVDGDALGSVSLPAVRSNAFGRAVEREASALRGLLGQVPQRAAVEEAFPEPEEEEPQTSEPERVTAVEDVEVAEAPGPNPVAIEVYLGMRLFSRKLSYNDDHYRQLRGYNLPLGPSIEGRLRWYPGAHFTSGIAAHIGIDAHFEQAFAIESRRRADNETFPTEMRSFGIGLRGRLPLGAHEVSLGVGFGRHDFVVEPAGPRIEGRSNLPEVPQVQSTFLRFGLEGRVHLVAGLRLHLGADYLVITSLGGIGSDVWFPRASAGGIEAHGGFGYLLGSGFEVRLAFRLRRFFYSMNPEVGDSWIAGGALDQYLGGDLGVAWAF